MLRMEQVHVIRHKVLREGRSVRQVARELGVSRNTIGRYDQRQLNLPDVLPQPRMLLPIIAYCLKRNPYSDPTGLPQKEPFLGSDPGLNRQ